MSGHVAYVGEKTNSYRILLTRPAGRRPLEDPDRDMMIILRCILKKWDGRMWTELIWLKTGTRGWLL